MAKAVGIDLGTTNSVVAFVNGGGPAVIASESGDTLLPSVVSVDGTETVYVGREAQRRLLTDAARTVYSSCRMPCRTSILEATSSTTRMTGFVVGSVMSLNQFSGLDSSDLASSRTHAPACSNS